MEAGAKNAAEEDSGVKAERDYIAGTADDLLKSANTFIVK